MPADGGFVKSFKAAKFYIPTIALMRAGGKAHEIAARPIGVTVVLAEDTVADLFDIEGGVVKKDAKAADVALSGNCPR